MTGPRVELALTMGDRLRLAIARGDDRVFVRGETLELVRRSLDAGPLVAVGLSFGVFTALAISAQLHAVIVAPLVCIAVLATCIGLLSLLNSLGPGLVVSQATIDFRRGTVRLGGGEAERIEALEAVVFRDGRWDGVELSVRDTRVRVLEATTDPSSLAHVVGELAALGVPVRDLAPAPYRGGSGVLRSSVDSSDSGSAAPNRCTT